MLPLVVFLASLMSLRRLSRHIWHKVELHERSSGSCERFLDVFTRILFVSLGISMMFHLSLLSVRLTFSMYNLGGSFQNTRTCGGVMQSA